MNRTGLALATLATIFSTVPPAQAQSASGEWQIVAAESGSIPVAGFPAGGRMYSDAMIGDTRGDQIGLRMTAPGTAAGYWSRQGSSWVRYAALNTAGAMPGPGRSGNESNHVFTILPSDGGGAGPDGQRLFVGRAGSPNDSTSETWGVWRWAGNRNTEILRSLTDGVLGPNLGSGWVMHSNGRSVSGRMLPGGRALFMGDTVSPTGAVLPMIGMHVPGQGNQPCVLRNSTDPGLSPGITPGGTFNSNWAISNFSVTPDARVYGSLSASNGTGIWEVCNGAPRAIAISNEAGVRGPHLPNATATFTSPSFTTPRLGEPEQFYFFAVFRPAAGQPTQTGLFWHDGQRNQPMALNGIDPAYAPGWMGSTWRSFTTTSLTSAGPWTAFEAAVNASDGGAPSGMWRIRAGGSPETVALIGLTGQYGPEPNRTWQSFSSHALMANGDLIVLAQTNPGSERALWLLRPGAAPRRLLKVGDSISVSTTSGSSQHTITGLSTLVSIAQHHGGQDSWAAADGTVLLQATLSGLGKVHLLSRPSNPRVMFADGFEN